MSEPARKVDAAEWVARAEDDPIAHQQRQTVHIVLCAIASSAPLKQIMVLKGGILMGLAYGSLRQTADVDLTADAPVDGNTADDIKTWLGPMLPRAAAALGYAGLTTEIHSIKLMPRKDRFETARAPALKAKVRSVRQDGMKTFVSVDISFKEELQQVEALELTEDNALLAYGLEDLVAEKYRAMLQQVVRHRNRRQDVYDLDLLIANRSFDDTHKQRILDALIVKCRSRQIEPTRDALRDPEIMQRSGADWTTIKLELGELPEFEPSFERVAAFYQDLPWGDSTGRQARVSAGTEHRRLRP